jgi:hypothetical protein
MLLCRKPWYAINWDVPQAFLKLSGLLLRAISNFLAYSLLLQPPLDYKPQIWEGFGEHDFPSTCLTENSLRLK